MGKSVVEDVVLRNDAEPGESQSQGNSTSCKKGSTQGHACPESVERSRIIEVGKTVPVANCGAGPGDAQSGRVEGLPVPNPGGRNIIGKGIVGEDSENKLGESTVQPKQKRVRTDGPSIMEKFHGDSDVSGSEAGELSHCPSISLSQRSLSSKGGNSDVSGSEAD